ncbi:PucR family transcriptional regulator [Spirillospora sp. CA-294931]|uniref:PucR family transcriptional regulator n=1 Tax=Spirillospora sp. CA-294931 TaxID=3240042 RepID=UPI003D9379D1
MDRLVEFSSTAGLRELSRALRPWVGEVTDEACTRIRARLPQFRTCDPRDARALPTMVEALIDHFVDLLEDPDRSSQRVLRLARQVGAGEARRGRDLGAWRAAASIATGVAVAGLTERAERHGLGVGAGDLGRIVQSVFAYSDRVADAVTAGHTEAGARAVEDREILRRRLIEVLLRPEPPIADVRQAARRAGWAVPVTVAVIALRPGPRRRPPLPPEALIEYGEDGPVVIMPDPHGPGRVHQIETGLHDRTAAVGPAVAITECAKSLRWARQALALADAGLIVPEKLIVATDHMPLITLMRERELVDLVAAQRLAPLAALRPRQRRDMTETLLALIENRFSATKAAQRLRVHPQTVRYRIRRLQSLFGHDLHDPRLQLDLHLVLHAQVARRTVDGTEGFTRSSYE